MKKYFFILLCLWCFPAKAQLKELMHAYDVDLNEKIPAVTLLEQEYKKATSRYDWKYDYRWNIPTTFDRGFKKQIQTFGSVEKRLNNPDEEELLLMLKRVPKSFYPYLGPMLHNMRGLSGKILDLPGIKETKNKFPERIASKLQDVPDIEFVSPELYIYLSPQFWGEDFDSLEFPQELQNQNEKMPNIKISPEFLKRVKDKVAARSKKKSYEGFRNFNPDENTPLSSADVRAFLDTLDGLEKFRKSGNNEIRLILIDNLMQYWDQKNGTDENAAFLKTVVNPCQTIVRKINWTNLRTEFQDAIGAQGFGLKDWAYTCDKVVKAARYIDMPYAYVTSIKLLKKGIVYKLLEKQNFTEEERQRQKYYMEAVVHMYDTSQENLDAVRPYAREVRDRLLSFQSEYVGTPIILP